MKKRVTAVLLTGVMALGLFGCVGGTEKEERRQTENAAEETIGVEETEIQVFIAASLNTVMTELAEMYNEKHPEVKLVYNADSSGTLLTQIQEGYECDLFFFSGAEADGYIRV